MIVFAQFVFEKDRLILRAKLATLSAVFCDYEMQSLNLCFQYERVSKFCLESKHSFGVSTAAFIF